LVVTAANATEQVTRGIPTPYLSQRVGGEEEYGEELRHLDLRGREETHRQGHVTLGRLLQHLAQKGKGGRGRGASDIITILREFDRQQTPN
jgi:hypothetical protein